MDKTLGSYSRSEIDIQPDEKQIEGDFEPNRLQEKKNQNSIDFRSLLSTISRDNEITSQVNRKLDELKES